MATVGSPVVTELVALTCLLGLGDITLLPFLHQDVSLLLLLDVPAMLSFAGLPSGGLHTTGGSGESTVGWPVACDPMAWTSWAPKGMVSCYPGSGQPSAYVAEQFWKSRLRVATPAGFGLLLFVLSPRLLRSWSPLDCVVPQL